MSTNATTQDRIDRWNSSKEFLKFTVVTAPFFLISIIFLDLYWATGTIAKIESQHDRDIALNMRLAERTLRSFVDNSATPTEQNVEILDDLLLGFSRTPGVGCVQLELGNELYSQPPQDFCDAITLDATKHLQISDNARLTYLTDDRYMSELRQDAKIQIVLFTVSITVLFLIFSYVGYVFAFRKHMRSLVSNIKSLFENYPVPTAQVNRAGEIKSSSLSWDEEIHIENYENIINFVDDAQRSKLSSIIAAVYDGYEVSYEMDVVFSRTPKDSFRASLKLSGTGSPGNRSVYISVYDVDDLYLQIDEKEVAARTDLLTDTLSRRALTDDLEKIDENLAFLLIDVDKFKAVNDLYGYHMGDKVIKGLGKYLQANCPLDGHVYRLGGDEFIMVFDQESEFDWDAMRDGFNTFEFDADGESFQCTLSAAYLSKVKTNQLTFILRKLDFFISAAKARGGNQTVSEQRAADLALDLHDSKTIWSAINNGEFFFEYEKIIDAITMRPVGYEGLIRWRHHKIVLGPANFIKSYYKATSSASGVQKRHELFVQSLLNLSDVTTEQIFYNITIEDLVSGRHRLLLDAFSMVINEKNIVLELSEAQFERRLQIEDMRFILSELKEAGFAIALDDFGKDSSNLNRFVDLPIDIVKADMELIANLSQSSIKQAVMRSLGQICNDFRIMLIAEGIESQDDKDALKALGVVHMQGFLFNSDKLQNLK